MVWLCRWELLWPMVVGGTAVLAPPAAEHDPSRMLRLLDEEQITHALLVPTALSAICDAAARGGFGPRSVPPLRHVLCIGEALPPALLASAHRLFPRTTFHNLYGPTKANFTTYECPRASAGLLDEHRLGVLSRLFSCCGDRGRAGARVPARSFVGRACGNTAVYIVDEQLQLVPIGEVGEICIGGVDAVADGYVHLPVLTAAKFVDDPFAEAHGGARSKMYRTGDRGRWSYDGQIAFLGRADRQVRSVPPAQRLQAAPCRLATPPTL
jgi:enterobactin synthetase component F